MYSHFAYSHLHYFLELTDTIKIISTLWESLLGLLGQPALCRQPDNTLTRHGYWFVLFDFPQSCIRVQIDTIRTLCWLRLGTVILCTHWVTDECRHSGPPVCRGTHNNTEPQQRSQGWNMNLKNEDDTATCRYLSFCRWFISLPLSCNILYHIVFVYFFSKVKLVQIWVKCDYVFPPHSYWLEKHNTAPQAHRCPMTLISVTLLIVRRSWFPLELLFFIHLPTVRNLISFNGLIY